MVYQQRPQPQTVVVRDRRSHGMGNMTTGIHSTFLLTHLIAISNGMQAVNLYNGCKTVVVVVVTSLLTCC